MTIKALSNKKFSIILHTYNRPELLKESANAIICQTYENLEIIIIDNGAINETKEFLYECKRRDKRVKLLHFKHNQFSWDDPMKYIPICYHAALEMSSGDYIWHQSDDDIIAVDYIEKMVGLFRDNPECTSASGRAVSFDINGKINQKEMNNRVSNYRPRYMPGHILALECLKGKNTLFSNPGQIFSFKRDELLKYGGFTRGYEEHQLYGIVPFGITGFDETACFFWRRHGEQLNIKSSSQGWIGTKEIFSMVKDLNIQDKWSVFGEDTARYVVTQIRRSQIKAAANWFSINLFALRVKGSLKILKDTWKEIYFWMYIPRFFGKRIIQIIFKINNVYKYIFSLIKSIIKFMVKPIINVSQDKWPHLSKKSDLFNKIYLKVNR